MKYSPELVMKNLEEFGFVFTSTHQQSEGEYASSDAEWNYNDVPHLNHVHGQADAVQGVIENDFTSSIFIQKIGPLSFPMTVAICSTSRSENFYFTSFCFYVLLVRTKWSTENNYTTVITDYFLGSKRILKFSHKFIHKLLANNYRLLMEGDIPMRSRRGVLRSRNYRFDGDAKGNGFLESVNLARCGVVPPEEMPVFQWHSLISEIQQGTTLVGSNDNSGVRLVRKKDLLEVFPRICMHAGASLDDANFGDGCVICPWHGKSIAPIMKNDLTKDREVHESNGIKVEVTYPDIFITGVYKS